MRDNSRGFRRVVRRLLKYFRPAVPFSGWQTGLHIPLSGQQKIVWQRYQLPLGGLRSPIRLAVMSDFHVGSLPGDRERLKECIDMVAQSQPDLVLLLGDFVNMQPIFGDRVSPEAICEHLARLTDGATTLAVLGNHDAEYGNSAIESVLKEIGVKVLRNEHLIIPINGITLAIAGVDDHSTGFPNISMALDAIPHEMPTILMSHDPALFGEVPNNVFLTICGHTHGGQIVLPLIGPVVNASEAPLKWTYGYVVEDGRNLIVTSGLGASGVPIRINCPSEIVEIILQPLLA